MNKNKFTISWGDFSRYRSSMFSLSIIGIMVFRYFEHIRSAYLLVSMPFFAWRDFIHLHTGILTFIRDLLFLNFIDHADTTYWFIFFIIVMYCKYNIHFDI